MQDEHGKWDEAAMREGRTEQPETIEDLSAYIDRLVSGQHDYGTCVYAMSMAATAAFRFAAHKLGVSGFQASCADLDVIRRTRDISGPFAIIDSDKMLYPQYSIPADVNEMLAGWAQWAADEARKRLARDDLDTCHPDVVAHWRRLAAKHPAREVKP